MTFYVRTPYGRFYSRPHTTHRHGYSPFIEGDIFVPVNIKAEDDAFLITALMPGLKAEDINIQIVGENVTLEGEFKNETADDEKYILEEIPSGKFFRTINLPDTLDAAQASAEMDKGILNLRVPKAEEAKPKTIKVNVK